MTTYQDQVKMFYQAGHQATANGLIKLIEARNTQRYKMVIAWHESGEKPEEWAAIEEFDKETDRQESILDDLMP